MNNENRQHCIDIAETLEAIHNNQMYRCPECGEYINEEYYDAETNACPWCKAEIESLYDCEQVGLLDYFENVLDIEYRVDSNRNYRSVRLMVACGGPNIWVDTKASEVQLVWWNESAYCPLDPETCDAIDECFEELFDC